MSLVRRIYRGMISALPKLGVIDSLVGYANFLRFHGRLPSDSGLMNDVLFAIKNGAEIENPLRVFTSDKEYVKLFVSAMVGPKYNVPTIAVLHGKEEVDTFDFPAACCIKPTHLSGYYVIRKAGEALPTAELKRWFDLNHYDFSRERNYRRLRPKLIVEPLVFGSSNIEDFKLFCHNGKVKFIQVDFDRKTSHSRRYFDRDWRPLDFTIIYPMSEKTVSRPTSLRKMIEIAERLASPFSLVRVDLYTDGTDVLVGEITHCAESANGRFIPRSAEKYASEILFSS